MSAKQAVSVRAGTPPVCVFSKHLQFITDFAELGKTCRSLGLDGIDLTVRRGGHILPENAEKALPEAVKAIRGEGVEVSMITTNLNDGADPDVRGILGTASSLGIRYFRIGGLKYASEGNPLDQLPGFVLQLGALAEVAAQYGMTAGYHNHSGYDYVAAPLWDLEQILASIGSDHIGSNFDSGHATVEGGYGAWRMNARMMAPRVKMMAVKDFVWGDDRPQWVPLGTGRVATVEFLKIFRKAGFAGPISLHFEYGLPSPEAVLDEVRQSVPVLRDAMSKAGYRVQ